MSAVLWILLELVNDLWIPRTFWFGDMAGGMAMQYAQMIVRISKGKAKIGKAMIYVRMFSWTLRQIYGIRLLFLSLYEQEEQALSRLRES